MKKTNRVPYIDTTRTAQKTKKNRNIYTDAHTHTARLSHKPPFIFSLFPYFLNEESRLKQIYEWRREKLIKGEQ